MNRKKILTVLTATIIVLLTGGLIVTASPIDTFSGSNNIEASSYATVLTVTSGLDVDTGGGGLVDGQPQTLRRAINSARNAPKPVLIQFAIPETCPSYSDELGIWKIEFVGIATGGTANTTLRQLNGGITIDGSTQPGGRVNGYPKIILYGHSPTGASNAMVLGENQTQDENIIRGLAFQNFADSVTIASKENIIEDCWFGLNDEGTAPLFRSGNPQQGSGYNGIAFTSIAVDNGNNIVRDNIFLGFVGTAATIRGRDNTFSNNLVGTAADGTVPNPGCTDDNWVGGGGVTVDGRRHTIENNTIAGLRWVQAAISTPPDALSVTVQDFTGAGHTIRNNTIGLDINGDVVGSCGRGIYLQHNMHKTLIENNTIVNTSDAGIYIIGSSYNECELRGNIIRGTTIGFGETVPEAYLEFKPPTVISIDGINVTGTGGSGSSWVELFMDETEVPREARELLARVQADEDGNWSATIPYELTGNQGIRTTLTTTKLNIIPGMKAGTTTGLSELYTAQPISAGDFLYGSFTDAVYRYDGTNWGATPVAHAPALALAAHEGYLYGAYGDGIYVYDGASWNINRITPGVASVMASYNGKLYGSFTDGIYVYDGTAFGPSIIAPPVNALASLGGLLYGSFADAVYAYDGTQWLPAPVAHAPALALAAHDGKLYGAYEDGIYIYDGTNWNINKITAGVANTMASYNGKLYGSFPDGIYVYDGIAFGPSIIAPPVASLAAY